jgi:hypothetical protein
MSNLDQGSFAFLVKGQEATILTLLTMHVVPVATTQPRFLTAGRSIRYVDEWV